MTIATDAPHIIGWQACFQFRDDGIEATVGQGDVILVHISVMKQTFCYSFPKFPH
jgi:hypothetical protein